MWRCNVVLLLLCLPVSIQAQTRDEIVRGDRKRVEAAGFWMYNDIPGAFAKAKETGKPIVVVLRCLPCHECVKLDDELVDTHTVIRPLLEQFVCVRQVGTIGRCQTGRDSDPVHSFQLGERRRIARATAGSRGACRPIRRPA